MQKSTLAVAVATALGVNSGAEAADVAVTLTGVFTGSTGGVSSGILSGTLTGSYNESSGIVTMDSGTTSVFFDLNPLPNNDLFTHQHTDWSTGAGSYSASGYSCVEGQFGGGVGAHLCGNYNFGSNFVNESSVNYAAIPGTRSLGGDDVAVGPQQQGSAFATTTASYGGGQLVMESDSWNSGGTSEAGIQLVFTVVPIPSALWLFGSALGLLGWTRRRLQT